MEIVNVNMGNRSGTPRVTWKSLLLLRLLWVTLVFQSLFVNLTMSSMTCGPGITSIGGTFPSGDIVLEYGSGVPLEITCVLDPEKKIVQNMMEDSVHADLSEQPSQRIVFYKNFEPISGNYVSIINSTAAQMRLIDPPAGKDTYYCGLLLRNQQNENHSDDTTITVTSELSTLDKNGVFPTKNQESVVIFCLNNVFVGYKPLQITNFSCISHNWDNLTCNWTKPLNPVKTTYQISFKLHGRSGGRITAKCPTDSDTTDNTCYWDISTSPMYRQPYEYYYFTLYGENALGNSSTFIRFHHYANVIPESPHDIVATHTTPSSTMLTWSIGPMAYFPEELVHKIEFKSRLNARNEVRRTLKFAGRPDCNSSSTANQVTSYFQKSSECHMAFNVTGLRHPFADYDFHIYVRTSSAHGEDKWSAPGSVTVKTKPTIPRRPPTSSEIGGFECIPSKIDQNKMDVVIYWGEIDEEDKCGDSFGYLAYYTSTTPDNKTIVHRSNKIFENYAVFEGLNVDNEYDFMLYSANSVGLSINRTIVHVTSESQRPQKPLAVTVMTFEEPGIYEVSWETHDSWKKSLDHFFMLFYCEISKDHPDQCIGHLRWRFLKSFTFSVNVTEIDSEKNYRFLVSKDTYAQNDTHYLIPKSSGLARESCRVLYGKSVENTMNLRVSVVGTNFMALKWSFNCTDRIGFDNGYHVNYCPVNSTAVNSACNGNMLTKTIPKDILRKEACIAILTNLKPLTTYMISISVITNHGKGLIYSETIYNTTLGPSVTVENETHFKNYEVKYF